MSLTIKCPHCQHDLDENILSQLSEQKVTQAIERLNFEKNKEIEQRLNEQQKQYLETIEKEKELALSNAKLAINDEIAMLKAEKDKAEQAKLQAEQQRKQDLELWADKQKQLIKEKELQSENEKAQALLQKEQELIKAQQELESLKNQFCSDLQKEKEIAEKNAMLVSKDELVKAQTELEKLKFELEALEQRRIDDIKLYAERQEKALNEASLQKENEKAQLVLEREQALSKVAEQKRDEIENIAKQKDLELEDIRAKLNEEKIILNHELNKTKEELELEKNFKSKLSVKLRGEDLEQHCQTEFELNRHAFPYAEFNKDNKVTEGAKGDFVYRDYTTASKELEILSIMFEMKNQNKDSVTKQTNRQFLEKLDKDRRNKGCEYAVLVTMLEEDNPVYEQGIVKSYEFDKMYIIRPAHFIALINMLKDAAMNNMDQKKELLVFKNQNAELVTLEKRINTFTDGFNKNYQLADKNFNKAIIEIDKSIKALENTKEELLKSTRNLGLASKKTDGLSIHKLMKGLPLVQQNYMEQLQNDMMNPTVDDDSDDGDDSSDGADFV